MMHVFVLFQAEVDFLGQLHHPNLVKLIGYCIEDDQRLLVYEFMTRGSLENHLFRSMFRASCKNNSLLSVLVFLQQTWYWCRDNTSSVVEQNKNLPGSSQRLSIPSWQYWTCHIPRFQDIKHSARFCMYKNKYYKFLIRKIIWWNKSFYRNTMQSFQILVWPRLGHREIKLMFLHGLWEHMAMLHQNMWWLVSMINIVISYSLFR